MRNLIFFLNLSCIIATAAPIAAKQILLDDVMTRDEQKKTGVYNLTLQQKVALEAWINKTFVLKQPETTSQKQLSLSINIDNGQKLLLSDNSMWEVSPNDIPTSSVWLSPSPVKIVPSNDPDYPFLIVDINSGISVKARKVPTAGQSAPAPAPTMQPPSSPGQPASQ